MTERMTPSEYRELKAEKPSKYRNKKVVVDGHRFDSKKEASRYLVLKARQEAGEISHLELQPRFNLRILDRPVTYTSGRRAYYVADFAYFDGSKRVIEDVKSPATKTQVYKLKKAVVEAMLPAVKIVEV